MSGSSVIEAAPAPSGGPTAGQEPKPVAIRADRLRKCYPIWSSPAARLQEPVWRATERLCAGIPPLRRFCQRQRLRMRRDFEALKGISFEIREGESVGIIGRNGSGKSTLLQILAGTLTPTEGHASVQGRLAALLELGSGFDPEFTGRQNVLLKASLLGLSRSEAQARLPQIEAFADIGEFFDQPVKTYSSGMAVRVAFAVNSLVDPDILIVDEALAVGDVFFQQKCFRLMNEQMQAKTRLIVTHEVAGLSRIAQRVIVLDRGHMVFDGPVKEGVRFYTKLMHDEAYALRREREAHTDETADKAQAAPLKDYLPAVDWQPCPEDRLSGRREAEIQSLALTDALGNPVPLVEPGTPLRIHAQVHFSRAPMTLTMGYLVLDRYGKNICGDNTLSLQPAGEQIAEVGRYYFSIDLNWPALMPGDYSITVGLGEGDHPFNHLIQCWAQDVLRIKAISPDLSVHGCFSNPVKAFACQRLAE